MCGGKVESDYENDYEIINKYDDYRKCYRYIKDYNQNKYILDLDLIIT